MSPIEDIKPAKDTTLALMLAAQNLGHKLRYLEAGDVHMDLNGIYAHSRSITVVDKEQDVFVLGDPAVHALDELDMLLMRVDPPFDTSYVFTTYLLEYAQRRYKLAVINDPASLRNHNEKLLATEFSEYCPPLLVSQHMGHLLSFIEEHGDIILKPLDKMGGQSIFRVRHGEQNTSTILESMLGEGLPIMAQLYLPDIVKGDKRIVLIEGKPVDHVLVRVPAAGEVRANLAAGGKGETHPLSARDRKMCEQIGARAMELGLVFVGLDVIGDYLTEANITSPTGVRELERASGQNIAEQIIEAATRRMLAIKSR